ncbi:flagellar hook-length control protein FliK [Legionella sp. CNM-4043-24]|uniref:flagellar hook-length control protein FliK n=1 Tax=Legionella sp. CNM-4043-24 TaxID=3421646 RepID=UPI00403B050B
MKIETGMLDSLAVLTTQTVVNDTPLLVFRDVLVNEKPVEQEYDDRSALDQPVTSPAPDMSLCYVNTMLALQSGTSAEPGDEMAESNPVPTFSAETTGQTRGLAEPAQKDSTNSQDSLSEGLNPGPVPILASLSLVQDEGIRLINNQGERALSADVQPMEPVPLVREESVRLADTDRGRMASVAVQPEENPDLAQNVRISLADNSRERAVSVPVQPDVRLALTQNERIRMADNSSEPAAPIPDQSMERRPLTQVEGIRFSSSDLAGTASVPVSPEERLSSAQSERIRFTDNDSGRAVFVAAQSEESLPLVRNERLAPVAAQPTERPSLTQDEGIQFSGSSLPVTVQPMEHLSLVQDESIRFSGIESEPAAPVALQPQETVSPVPDFAKELTQPRPIQKQPVQSVAQHENLRIPVSLAVQHQDTLRVAQDRTPTILAPQLEQPVPTAIQHQPLHRLSQDREPVPLTVQAEDFSLPPAGLTQWIHEAVNSARQQDSAVNALNKSGDDLNGVQTINKSSFEHHPPESLPAVDTMVSNVADFFNKKLELAGQNNLKTPVDFRAGLDQPLDGSQAPASFKYNPGSLARSLSVDGYHARISLHPADLGHITADIQVNNGTTELRLSTETAQVRQFVESHLQSLRDSFQTMNIQLGDVQVQEHASSSHQGDAQKRQDDARHSAYRQETPERQEPRQNPRRSNAMVDTYA